MASYDLKAILGEKLKRLTDKTLKVLVDCMCTVCAALCGLDKRVSALESVELPEGGYKPMQEPVASPSASGTAIQFIDSMSQDATGRMTATKKTVRTGSTSQTGVLQLTDSHTSTSTTTAATPKNVKEAYDLASGKADPASVVDSAVYDSANHAIIFKHGSTQLFTLDAAAFVKDGMVDSVAIVNGNLVITFNTDAGKQPISIPLTDIFNPNNYYTKTDTNALLAAKQPGRLVVSYDDNTAFSNISAAIAAGKDVWLNTNGAYSGATYSHYVPLTEAVFRNGAYTAFVFARPRAYSDENGIMERWTCSSSSWTYETEQVAYAVTAGSAAEAGTANSASNANLEKTTDATNGDLLYIGGGTQQRIGNAGHANSAKDYDSTGAIATALNSKQNTISFTNLTGGTASNPAADKAYVDSAIASWMLAAGTSYVKYRCNGEGIGSGNIGSIFWLSQIIYLAQDTVRIDIRGDFSSITKDNRLAIFPAYAYCGLDDSVEIRLKCKQYVRYLITLTNVGDSSATIWAISGGRATQSQTGYLRRGTLQIDGATYETDTVTQPQGWDIGYFNWGAIGSIPAKSSRTWEMFWYGTEDTPGTAFSGRDYTYITTIK